MRNIIKNIVLIISYFLGDILVLKKISLLLYHLYLKKINNILLNEFPNISIYTRGSLISERNFKPFFSDIDLTLIITQKILQDHFISRLLRLKEKFWFKSLPLIGEIEIVLDEDLGLIDFDLLPASRSFFYCAGFKRPNYIGKNINNDITFLSNFHNYFYYKNIIENSIDFTFVKKIKLKRLASKICHQIKADDVMTGLVSLTQQAPISCDYIITNSFLGMSANNDFFKIGLFKDSASAYPSENLALVVEHIGDKLWSALLHIYNNLNREDIAVFIDNLILIRSLGHYINTFGTPVDKPITQSFIISAMKEYIGVKRKEKDQLCIDAIEEFNIESPFSKIELDKRLQLIFSNL